MTYDGRIEAQCVVPAGVSVSATTDMGTQTVTMPAGSYFMTGAGGVNGVLHVLTNALNTTAPARGYPNSAVAMNAAVGYGTWTAGWLCDEASGNLAAVFGSPTLTASGSPTYHNAGPRGGSDYAVGFTAAADNFDGGNNFDAPAGTDVMVAWVGKFSASPSLTRGHITKFAGTPTGWAVQYDASGIYLMAYKTTGSVDFQTGYASLHAGSYHAGIAVFDRATLKGRIATVNLATGVVSISAEVTITNTSYSNAVAFRLGRRADSGVDADAVDSIAAVYVGTGAGAATGLSANLSQAATNFANAINAAWTASLSTGPAGNGEVTLNVTGGAIQPAWDLAWTGNGTNLRDLLGFTVDLTADYPRTAVAMNAAVGYGTWSAGWLCNETSGSLQPSFGSPALAPSTSPTYANDGPRGGTDKAVGFDSAADAFTGGDVFDVNAGEDLALAWVAKASALPGGSVDWFSKGSANPCYYGFRRASGSLAISINDSISPETGGAGPPVGEWHVGIAVLDRSTNRARIGVRGLVSGTAVMSAEIDASAIGSCANAAAFTIGAGAIGSVDTALQYAAFYVAEGVGVATGLSANLSTALLNFAAMVGARTGAQCARGVFLPDAPLSIEGDPPRAPVVSDLRATIGPTGLSYAIVGNYFYRQMRLRYSHVTRAKIREAIASPANSSWEKFIKDTQLQLGHPWFNPGSAVQIYDLGGQLVGLDANSSTGLANGWNFSPPIASIEPTMSVDQWTGLWKIELPDLISSG